jgi:hypothetical protein
VNDAIESLAVQAQFDGETREVFLRVGEADGKIFIDRGSPDWQIVQISAEGCRNIQYQECPVRFRRGPSMGLLPEPIEGGSIDELRRFINVSDDEWPLVLAFLMAALRAKGPHPVLPLVGRQGDGKSTMARVFKALVDPSEIDLRTPPRESRDLVAAVRNTWLPVFDNLSWLPGDLSDALCRLSTGGSFGGRQLYRDFDEATFSAERPVILTSIIGVVVRPDLIDRSLIIRMMPIFDRQRRPEAEFWDEFQSVAPRILGCLYRGLSLGLRDSKSVKLPELPRIADFAVWGTPGFRGSA